MLSHQLFIVFSDQWGRHPSSCEHIIRVLLRYDNEVAWVNTIGMRTPQLTLYDLKRSFGKIWGWIKGRTVKEQATFPNLQVINPVMIPYNGYGLVRRLNSFLVKRAVSRVIGNDGGGRRPIVLASVTNVADYVGLFDAGAVVYYCVDDYVEWPGADRNLVVEMEEQLLADSDLVLATADPLCDKKVRNGRRPYFLPHGVDFDHFNVQRQEEHRSFFGSIRPPVIGFFGALSAWLDFDLIVETARKRPEWSFVFIGPADTDITMIEGVANIHLMGKVPYGSLPQYACWFDVGVIPFLVNPLTISVNPLKLIEYLACGLPVVSVDLPEVRKFSEVVYIADTPSEFELQIEAALADDSEPLREMRRAVARSFSWESIAERFGNLVQPVLRGNSPRETLTGTVEASNAPVKGSGTV